jgi:hypothetical protein
VSELCLVCVRMLSIFLPLCLGAAVDGGGGRELLDEGPRCLVPPLVMIIFRRSEALGSAVKCGLLKTLENR